MADKEQNLRDFAQRGATPTVTEIVPGTIYHVAGYGHSNATFVIANESVILIDTLDSDVRGARLLELIQDRTTKPVRTIIYTHGHPDHRGGAGSLITNDPEIIAFKPVHPPLGRTEMLADILNARGARQFGYHLKDEDVISQGLGPREGITQGESYAFILPSTIYSGPAVKRTIDGIDLELIAAPGETDDTINVWFPQYGVLCSADNYYECWPNISAIRGHQYRDVDRWIQSLQHVLELRPVALLPGHFQPILGAENVAERIGRYKEAIEFVLERTLQLLNQGMTPREVVAAISLPDHLASLEYLAEFYGTIEWSVYGIFSGYIGWFDGNPTNLHPLEFQDRARRYISSMGGADCVLALADEAVANSEFQWALELTDFLMAYDPTNDSARTVRIRALKGAARNERNATARNYYIASAKELEG